MRKAVIDVSLRGKTFNIEFEISDNVKEYQVADVAYATALRFADTQIMAIFGHSSIPSKEFSKIMHDLDYNYQIKETE